MDDPLPPRRPGRQRDGAAGALVLRPVTLSGLLVLAMFCGTFSLATLSALGPFLVQDLDLSRAQLGGLSSAVFVTGALASLLVGRRIDARADRSLMTGLFAMSAVAVVAMASAPEYPWLLSAAAISGIGLAIANPATNALLSRHRVEGARGWMLGVKQSGQPVTMLLGGFLLPPLALAVGWRLAVLTIVLFAAAGLVWSRARIGRPASGSHGDRSARTGAEGRTPTPALLAYGFLMGLGMSGIAAHLPLFAFEELGVSPAVGGTTTAAIGASGVVGRLVWARGTERLRRSLWTLAVIPACTTVPVIGLLVATPRTWWLAWIGAVGVGLLAHSWNAAATIVLMREVTLDSIARATALLQVTFFAGLTASPILVGTIGDHFRSFRPAWGAMLCVYVLATVIAGGMRRTAR